MEKEWDQQFWDTFDNHAPEAPRHVQLARLESVEPLVVNLGGLLYEQAQGEVYVNHYLTKRAYEQVQIARMSSAWRLHGDADLSAGAGNWRSGMCGAAGG